MPCVGEIQVVVWNNTLREHWCPYRVQSQVRELACEERLRRVDKAQYFRIEMLPSRLRAARQAGRNVIRSNIDTCVVDLVDQRCHDAGTVVGTVHLVEVTLIAAAELKQVIAMKISEVVAKLVIVAIPFARADILIVHIVRLQRVIAFTTDLESAGKAGELWRSHRRTIRP